MSKFELLKLLQEDIRDIKGLINFNENGLTIEEMKKIGEGIIGNLENHLEEFIKLS